VYNSRSDICYEENKMEFVPYRLLRNQPDVLRRKLADQGELVVTVDGKPFAVMIDLSGNDNLDDIMLMVSRLRAQMAARSIRSQARRDGLDKITAEQVDDIVRKTRAARE
jgi:hypothetical protein